MYNTYIEENTPKELSAVIRTLCVLVFSIHPKVIQIIEYTVSPRNFTCSFNHQYNIHFNKYHILI